MNNNNQFEDAQAAAAAIRAEIDKGSAEASKLTAQLELAERDVQTLRARLESGLPLQY